MQEQKKRILYFFACFCDNLVRKTAQFNVFQFWSVSSNSVSECLLLDPQKQVASIFFTAFYSFMAAWQQTQNSETKNGGGFCVCVCVWNFWKQTQNSTTNPKLGNKKSWGGRWASWFVCWMFETNPKLNNKPKTRRQKIVGWALSIVVCVYNFRNKPKTRKQN